MEQQSKAFHIWKAVEMAAKERSESSSDDDNADMATLKYIQKLLSDLEDNINGDNLIFKLLQLHAEQSNIPGLQTTELELWRNAGQKIARVVRIGRHEKLTKFDARAMSDLKVDALDGMKALSGYLERSNA
ncbi:hypothetical protein AL471_014540 [Vibrio alginolyticus]|uniref:hypothetical protein n=1 Tax=Vibrio alginolyticus TaxID=663 RepID=UPI00076DC361|nr:hypothetical protein [Vibrio alginolyticus]PNP21991.1 hypothetical protein AL471_014540 [Vibrio alginolyticus]